MNQLNENFYFSGAYDFCCSNVNFLCRNKLNILQINARSIKSDERADALKTFLKMLKVDLDVIVIGETWFDEEGAQAFGLDGYRGEYSVRSESGGGGLMVFISERHDYSKFSLIVNGPDSLSLVSMKIHLNKNCQQQVVLHGAYRPGRMNFSESMEILETILNNGTNDNCILVGDMNIDTTKKDVFSTRYRNLLNSYGFIVGNEIPTREGSGTLIDHFISNLREIKIIHSTIVCEFSDHSAVLSSLNFEVSRDKYHVIEKTIYNFDKINTSLSSYCDSLRPKIALMSADQAYNEFEGKMKRIMENCSRVKTYKLKNNSDFLPYLNNKIIAKIKEKERIMKKLKKLRRLPRSEEANCSVSNQESRLRLVSDELIKLKRKSKKEYYISRFAGAKNVKEKWKMLFRLMGGEKKKNVRPKLKMNGDVISVPHLVASEFNSYFCSVGKNVSQKIPKKTSDSINAFNTIKTQRDSFFLTPTTPHEVLREIARLRVGKACGPDGVSPAVVRRCAEPLSHILSILFNKSIEDGIYPGKLKISRVIPILKKGDTESVGNYRPISIYSIFNKLFERLLYVRVFGYFDRMSFFFRRQYGFRPKCSTSTAVLEIISHIYEEIDDKKIVGGVFLDIEKCFDTIDHGILLEKLYNYGFRGHSYTFFESFFEGRLQYVEIDGQRSSTRPVTMSVFQGSSLGPLFYLIFCNDMGQLALEGRLHLFADDTCYFVTGSRVEEVVDRLQRDLAILFEYFRLNRLSVNATKTEIVFFRTPNRRIPNNITINVNDTCLTVTDRVKYLGVILDDNLNWKFHLEQLCGKVSRSVGILRRLSYSVPPSMLRNVYYAIVHSHLSYCCLAWGSTLKSYLVDLQVLQNRALKCLTHLPRLTSTFDVFRVAKIPSVKQEYYLQLGLLMNDLNNDRVHSNLAVDFTQSTRHQTVRPKFARTKTGERNVLREGPKLLNALPGSLRSCSNRISFKHSLLDWLNTDQNLRKILNDFSIH